MSRPLVIIALTFFLSTFTGQVAHAGQFLGKGVDAWQADLRKGDDVARRSAAFALGKIGSQAMDAVADLKKALVDDKDARVREAAAFALGEIAKESLKIANDPTLVKVLGQAVTKDQNLLVRRSAAIALGSLGSDGKGGLASLLAAMADPSPMVRQNAAWALGKVGAAGVVGLRKALHDPDPLVQRDAATALGGLDRDAVRQALPDLFEMCKTNNSDARRSALAVLIKVVNADDEKGIGAIRTALADRDEDVRINAALTISNIGGEDAAVAVPHLLKALRQDDVDQRRQAAAAIRNIGPGARKAVPELVKTLSDADPEVRGNAALALGGIGPDAAEACPSLAELIQNSRERQQTRVEAAVALSRIGAVPASVRAVPALLKVLANSDEDARVRERIVWALRVHNTELRRLPDVYPSFTKVIKEAKSGDNRMLRFDCAFMLGMLQGPTCAPEVMNVLHEFLKDDSIQIYVTTKVAVEFSDFEKGSKGNKQKELGKGDGRIMAVRALHQIGPDRVLRHPGIMTELRKLAADNALYPDLRILCRELLKDIAK